MEPPREPEPTSQPSAEPLVRFGSPRRHLRSTTSTNDLARELALAGCPAGTVVTADEQSAGRGRQGRSWIAPAGGALLCSAVVRPLALAGELLPLAVPIAVCEAVEALGGGPCAVKWPNDVWVEGRKVAGVLIEARAGRAGGTDVEAGGFAVIGVGLNVSLDEEDLPAELRGRTASIGPDVRVEDALEALVERLGAWTGAAAADVLAAYEPRDAIRGLEVSWTGAGGEGDAGTGVASGVNERGELVVALGGGRSSALAAGEVHLGGLAV